MLLTWLIFALRSSTHRNSYIYNFLAGRECNVTHTFSFKKKRLRRLYLFLNSCTKNDHKAHNFSKYKYCISQSTQTVLHKCLKYVPDICSQNHFWGTTSSPSERNKGESHTTQNSKLVIEETQFFFDCSTTTTKLKNVAYPTAFIYESP